MVITYELGVEEVDGQDANRKKKKWTQTTTSSRRTEQSSKWAAKIGQRTTRRYILQMSSKKNPVLLINDIIPLICVDCTLAFPDDG